MKTLNVLKRNLFAALVILFGLALTACQNSSPQNGPRQRSNVTAGIVNPTTGQVMTNLSWGAITTGGAFSSSTLSILTNGASGIGYVSGAANDSSGTGVLFRGQIDQNSGTGTVGIGIWDSNAAVDGEPYYWEMGVVQVTPTSNGAQVIVQKGNSVFIFNGTFSGSMWTGPMLSEDPSSGQMTTLGTFTIQSCSIFSC